MKKNAYIKPEIETMLLVPETVMGLELGISNTTVDDEAAKEQPEFEETETMPTSPNIWGDTEEED